ncbi:MAG: acetyltransferase family protein [Gemmatimonadetes bacterium]|nr:acetyltransferase family protein [Gemmatimonadota bacterium]
MSTNAHGQPVGADVAGWSVRAQPSRNSMVGHYCRVEPVHVERHADDLFAAWSDARDDRDWTYLVAERPHTAAECRAYVEKLSSTSDPLHYAIIDANGTAVGTAALMRIDPAHGVIEVGSITYSPRLQRTRAGTEAMYLLMRHAFDDLGYRRYEWKCDTLNAPSQAAARRYGFVFEGIFRQALVYKGRNRDTAWFSIIDREWPAVRAALQAWLNPTNFESNGLQKTSLGEVRSAQ